MNNRLQFRHHNEIFVDRESAIEYIKSEIRNAQEGLASKNERFGYSLFAEPTVLLYKNEEDETNPHLIIAIGSVTNNGTQYNDNRFCFIDIDKTEKEIADLAEEVEQAVRSLNVIALSSDTLNIYADREEDGTYISGDVKVAESHVFDNTVLYNNLITYEDGLFIYVDLSYDENTETFKFTVTNHDKTLKETSVKLPNNYLVSGEYKPEDESIHLTMKNGDEVIIDCEKLIAEWTVEGEASNTPIVLKREQVNYSDDSANHEHVPSWQDVLSADIRIATDMENNILNKTEDGKKLYVEGKAKNIAYETSTGDTTVQSEITNLHEGLNEENARAISAETALRTSITDEIVRATSAENTIANNLNAEVTRATSAENANTNAINAEVARATAADEANATAINNEKNRAESEESRIEEKLDKLADDTTYKVINTNSITLTKADEAKGTSITADLNVSENNGNIIKIETDGVFASADLVYDAATNKLTFKTTNGSKEIALVSNSLVERVYYDANNEQIIIVYKVNGQTMPDVVIPVRDLINEIDVASTETIELTRTIDTTSGADIIRGNVKINSVHDDNILINDGGLYVSGAQIEENRTSIVALNSRMTTAESNIEDNAAAITAETSRATSAENTIDLKITNEISRATNKENEIASNLSAEVTRATEKDNALQTALTQEVNNRIAAITAEETRATSAETSLQNAISTLNGKVETISGKTNDNKTAIETEVARSTAKDVELANTITAEETRATSAETSLQNAINAEVTRATAADEANATAITTETSRAISAETALQNAITAEVTRATAAEGTNAAAITAETSRATSAETSLQNAITTEATRSTERDNVLQTALTQEVNNRIAAITAEETRATSAETALQNAITAEVTRATAAEQALDTKIDAITFEVTSEDSTTLDLTVENGNKISGNVLVANGDKNIIKATSDLTVGTGLYASVDINYDVATNKLKLITSAFEKEISLSTGSIIKSIEYDSVGKNLIIKYDTDAGGQIIEQVITVPVEDLFNDWVVQEGQHFGAILLHKTEGTSGNPDVLSAEVVLSTLSDNMVINDQGALYVSKQPIIDLEDEVAEIQSRLHDDIRPQETSTLNLQIDSAYNLYGRVKLSDDNLNLIKVDGDNGLIFDGTVDYGEF